LTNKEPQEREFHFNCALPAALDSFEISFSCPVVINDIDVYTDNTLFKEFGDPFRKLEKQVHYM
jgi:hypothetical protein